ncbi:hypothetical protein PVAP13_9KG061357 [Panicum virgatum]|uniref:Uncharacterized protein n=1 Tax=Panicum virgatum TaxID=38727 RepID=A0A8T0NCX2_PANVG|nr:hypothetical protein PVAP13_9KG061357 [Panicum virgatum]
MPIHPVDQHYWMRRRDRISMPCVREAGRRERRAMRNRTRSSPCARQVQRARAAHRRRPTRWQARTKLADDDLQMTSRGCCARDGNAIPISDDRATPPRHRVRFKTRHPC